MNKTHLIPFLILVFFIVSYSDSIGQQKEYYYDEIYTVTGYLKKMKYEESCGYKENYYILNLDNPISIIGRSDQRFGDFHKTEYNVMSILLTLYYGFNDFEKFKNSINKKIIVEGSFSHICSDINTGIHRHRDYHKQKIYMEMINVLDSMYSQKEHDEINFYAKLKRLGEFKYHYRRAGLENSDSFIFYHIDDDKIRYYYNIREITDDYCYITYEISNLIDYNLKNDRIVYKGFDIIQRFQRVHIIFSRYDLPESCERYGAEKDYSRYYLSSPEEYLVNKTYKRKFYSGNTYDCRPILEIKVKDKEVIPYPGSVEKILHDIIYNDYYLNN